MDVRDALTSKQLAITLPPAETMRFEVPASMTLPDASLLVRVDAFDGHANRLASVERPWGTPVQVDRRKSART